MTTINMDNLAWWHTSKEEVAKVQNRMDAITSKLSSEDVRELESLIEWAASEAANEREGEIEAGADL